MAASHNLYACMFQFDADGTIDMNDDDIMCALVTASYTPNATTHTVWADVSANEIAAGFGYTAGGLLIPAVTYSQANRIQRSGATTTFYLDDAVWTATGGPIPAWRYAILYAATTRNGRVNPLISYVLGDITPADIPATVDTAALRIRWNPSGVFSN